MDNDTRLKNLKNNHLQLLTMFEALENRINILEEKRKKENHSKYKLIEAKEDFESIRPHEYTEPFTDFQLVFWGSYLTKGSNRVDKVDNWKEVVQRKKKIVELIKFFQSYAEEHGVNKEESENWARKRLRDYIEYCITMVKNQEGDIPNFYQYTSDWYLTTYSHKVAEYQKLKDIENNENRS